MILACKSFGGGLKSFQLYFYFSFKKYQKKFSQL